MLSVESTTAPSESTNAGSPHAAYGAKAVSPALQPALQAGAPALSPMASVQPYGGHYGGPHPGPSPAYYGKLALTSLTH